jgi:hypothetical protein
MVVQQETNLDERKIVHPGWIGVDLDGTLAHYDEWVGWNVFGAPITPMVARVRAWLAAGVTVKIVTARVGLPLHDFNGVPYVRGTKNHVCRVTGENFSDLDMVKMIQGWTMEYIGARLPVQCYKDVDMAELWDDRAVQVVPNQGITLSDAHAAELSALRGKAFQS